MDYWAVFSSQERVRRVFRETKERKDLREYRVLRVRKAFKERRVNLASTEAIQSYKSSRVKMRLVKI